ncbi:MAG: hypothetical protein OXC57_08835 [Rhodobacteraceae bacterium]|nr:hypothetical protein [Paracoccaceae bacterium]
MRRSGTFRCQPDSPLPLVNRRRQSTRPGPAANRLAVVDMSIEVARPMSALPPSSMARAVNRQERTAIPESPVRSCTGTSATAERPAHSPSI